MLLLPSLANTGGSQIMSIHIKLGALRIDFARHYYDVLPSKGEKGKIHWYTSFSVQWSNPNREKNYSKLMGGI